MKLFPALLLAACLLNTSLRADEIPNVIFDTDIAGDVDDVLALAMLHTLADRDELNIAAVTVSKSHPLNVPMVDAINTFYGRANLPIGVTKGDYPRESIARDFRYRVHHIVPESYLLHSGPLHDRPTWDLTSVLIVARENDNYIHYSEPGTVEVDERLTGALQDRLTHRIEVLSIDGDSYRLQKSQGSRTSG